MMTAGISMAIRKPKILPGALVMVSYPMETNEQTKNVAKKFEGHEFVVKTRHQPVPTKKPQFTLYGCESEYGLPYWFLEDELVVLSEVKRCH